MQLKALRVAAVLLISTAAGAAVPVELAAALAAAAAPAAAQDAPQVEHLNHGRFENLSVYLPAAPPPQRTAPPPQLSATPKSVVLFLSGERGWTAGVGDMARELAQRGALVIGIDTPKFMAKLEADGNQCVFPDGDLENLSHFAQAYYQMPTYLAPILVGYAAGATLAYATLAQAPKNTFAAALTLGFCPTVPLNKPLCKGTGVDFKPLTGGRGVEFLPIQKLDDPWVALQGAADTACPVPAVRQFIGGVEGAAFVSLPRVGHDFSVPAHWVPQFSAAFESLAKRNPSTALAPPPAALGNLPVIEVAAQPGIAQSDAFAIILSGDGGWAGLDREIATALSAGGIPVIGLDSLRYFWTARTPDGIAADIDRMVRYYMAHLGKKRVLLIGYSQGADVLPFAVNRLPPATRSKVALTAIIGMSEHALFEFHVSSWLSDDNSGPATLPEVDRLSGTPVLCIYGADEDDSLCPKLDAKKITVVKLKGGHHFDGDYAGLAGQILANARR